MNVLKNHFREMIKKLASKTPTKLTKFSKPKYT